MTEPAAETVDAFLTHLTQQTEERNRQRENIAQDLERIFLQELVEKTGDSDLPQLLDAVLSETGDSRTHAKQWPISAYALTKLFSHVSYHATCQRMDLCSSQREDEPGSLGSNCRIDESRVRKGFRERRRHLYSTRKSRVRSNPLYSKKSFIQLLSAYFRALLKLVNCCAHELVNRADLHLSMLRSMSHYKHAALRQVAFFLCM